MSAWIGLIGVVIGIILTASVEEFRKKRKVSDHDF